MIFVFVCGIVTKLSEKDASGCSAVLVARLNGVQEAVGSTPATRTRKKTIVLQSSFFNKSVFDGREDEFHYAFS